MVRRGAEETKRRLVDAAAAEFAAHGISGARTSRIAWAAGANEALLFRYFGSKQALFEHVYDALVFQTVDDVPMDADHLPEYAEALFDYYREHQQVLRLAVWGGLERPDAPATNAVQAATDAKIDAVARAQRAGTVADRLPPAELLSVVIQLSLSGGAVTPTLGIEVSPDVRRRSVGIAVKALTDPIAQR